MERCAYAYLIISRCWVLDATYTSTYQYPSLDVHTGGEGGRRLTEQPWRHHLPALPYRLFDYLIWYARAEHLDLWDTHTHTVMRHTCCCVFIVAFASATPHSSRHLYDCILLFTTLRLRTVGVAVPRATLRAHAWQIILLRLAVAPSIAHTPKILARIANHSLRTAATATHASQRCRRITYDDRAFYGDDSLVTPRRCSAQTTVTALHARNVCTQRFLNAVPFL